MSNKLIKDMDEETWNRFIAFCKLKKVKVNEQLKELLEEFLEKNFSKLVQQGRKEGKGK